MSIMYHIYSYIYTQTDSLKPLKIHMTFHMTFAISMKV